MLFKLQQSTINARWWSDWDFHASIFFHRGNNAQTGASLCTLIPNKKQSSHQKSTGSKLKFVNNTVSKSGAFPRLHTQFLQMSVRCMSNFQSEGCVSNWISNPSHFQPSCLHRLNQKHLCTGPEGSSWRETWRDHPKQQEFQASRIVWFV